MVIAPRLVVVVALAIAWIPGGCHPHAPPSAIDPSLASYIPPGTMVLAGVDLTQLRASDLYRKLSAASTALAEPLRNASYVMVASSGSDVTAFARGDFREPPQGAEQIAPRLAVFGSPDGIRAARAQHRTGVSGAPDLLTYAEPLAGNPVWAVARGSATLPLTGNLANLNGFLHSTEYATAAAQIADTLSLNLTGICRTPTDAQHLERTLRAFVSLAGLRSPGPLAQTTITLDHQTVRVTLAAQAADVEKLLH